MMENHHVAVMSNNSVIVRAKNRMDILSKEDFQLIEEHYIWIADRNTSHGIMGEYIALDYVDVYLEQEKNGKTNDAGVAFTMAGDNAASSVCL